MILRIGNKSVSQFASCPVIRLNRHTGKPENRKTKKAFTLVELMISVIILGFGLSIILRTYLTSLAGLESSENYIESMRFAQKKIDELEVTSYENNGLIPGNESGKIGIGPREFTWKTEISEISNPEYLSKNYVLATVSLDWLERTISKNSTLTTYLPKKKEPQEPAQ